MDTNSSFQFTEHSEVFLPLDLNYIPEELKKRARSELFEDEETRVQSLELLKSMIRNETNLNCLDDDLHLLAFLRARKFDVKRAFSLLKNYYGIMKKFDEAYNNFNYDDVRKTLQENSIGFLPYRDKEGCVIIVFLSENWNPYINDNADLLRTVACGMSHAICSPATQITGVKAIIDCSGLKLWKLPYMKTSYMWAFAQGLQNSFPARFKGIHLVNENFIFPYIWPICKHFVSKKIRDRIHFHGKDMKKLHKSFSPKILPAEFGGDLKAFDNSEWAAKLAESADYFSNLFSHGYKKRKK